MHLGVRVHMCCVCVVMRARMFHLCTVCTGTVIHMHVCTYVNSDYVYLQCMAMQTCMHTCANVVHLPLHTRCVGVCVRLRIHVGTHAQCMCA